MNFASSVLSDQMPELFESESIYYIQIDLNIENTSDEDIIFYVSQATIVTSTGEQLENDMLISDHISGILSSLYWKVLMQKLLRVFDLLGAPLKMKIMKTLGKRLILK